MKKVALLILIALPSPIYAQAYTPQFTQGSMTSTSVTETTVTESYLIEKYGGAIKSAHGYNVTPSGDINATDTTWSVQTAGQEFQLEQVTRAAGVIETQDIDRVVETTTTTTSLSVFSN